VLLEFGGCSIILVIKKYLYLDGGLVKWKNENKKKENGSGKNFVKSNFKCYHKK
jgi:hypothetical protein